MRDKVRPRVSALTRCLGAEYLGTAGLLVAIVGSGIAFDRMAGESPGLVLLANAVATGLALRVLIMVWGSVSGAHFNPAVTLVMAVRREITIGLAVGYILAQLSGALCGVLVTHAMFDQSLWQTALTVRTGTGQVLSEAVATLGLVMVILFVRRSHPHALAGAVGGYITAAILCTASASFANPAVTLARALTDSFTGIALGGVLPFVMAQIAGALLALGCFYCYARAQDP